MYANVQPNGVVVDCDPALGVPFRDVDDALAVLALVAAGVPIAAITVTWGNVPLARALGVARWLGGALGVPVFAGASRAGDADTEAARVLAAHRGPVLGLGPCTNIASALARGASWSELYLLGGTTRSGPNVRYVRMTELNFALDAPAAARALAACDLLFPMEPCRQVVFDAADLAALPDSLRRGCRSWLALAPLLTRTRGFHPWDLLAALALAGRLRAPGLPPSAVPLFRTEQRQGIAVETRWPQRGLLYEAGGARRYVEVVTGVDQEAVRGCWRSLIADRWNREDFSLDGSVRPPA